MKWLLITIVTIIIVLNTATAQYLDEGYKTAIGVRFYPGAVSIKHFFQTNSQTNSAVEGLVYFRKIGTRVTALYEWHHDFTSLEGLKWFIGGGAHAEFLKHESQQDIHSPAQANPAIGVDAITGLDYKVNSIPLNISLDWQPSITFINDNYTNGDWISITLRYAF